jgi:hypothetical protein
VHRIRSNEAMPQKNLDIVRVPFTESLPIHVRAKLHRLSAIEELQRRDSTPDPMKRIKSLNVFDMLSPRYDNPQSLETVRRWIAQEGLELVRCDIGYNGINAKARRPQAAPVEMANGS